METENYTGTYLNTTEYNLLMMSSDIMGRVESRLLGLDDEIHSLLQYIRKQKESDINTEIEEYENLKKLISQHMKEPLDPTSELRRLREKQYLV
jgi:hypothetical protein